MSKHYANDTGKTNSKAYAVSPYAAYGAANNTSNASGRKKHHKALIVTIVVLAILVVILACAAFVSNTLYRSLSQVRTQANTAMASVQDIQNQVSSQNYSNMQQDISQISTAVHAIDNELSGWSWSVAEHIPVYGGDVTTARSFVDTLSDLTDNALQPAASSLSGFSVDQLIQDGSIDTALVSQIAQTLQEVEPVLNRSVASLQSLPTAKIEQINTAIAQATDALSNVDQTVTKINTVLPYIPQMLGADGVTRNYLVIAQNNSEIRATGGYAGAWCVVSVTNGSVEMGDVITLAGARDYAFDITEDEASTFGADMAISPTNLNSTPNFERAGKLFADAWSVYEGQTVDGVIAIDPVFLQGLLALTGGVVLDDGTVVDGTNAAQLLLSDTYWIYPNGDDQDAFFSYVAGVCLDQIQSSISNVSLSSLKDFIETETDERRLQAWFVNEDEENLAKQYDLAGEISSDPTEPQLGVYVNDNTWAKMCWYLDMRTTVNASLQHEDGTITYSVTSTFGNTITEEEAALAPAYVTGNNPDKFSDADMIINPLLVAPAGGIITDVTVSNGQSLSEGSLYNHDVWRGEIHVGAQETVVITYNVTVPAGTTSTLAVKQTPTGQTFA